MFEDVGSVQIIVTFLIYIFIQSITNAISILYIIFHTFFTRQEIRIWECDKISNLKLLRPRFQIEDFRFQI